MQTLRIVALVFVFVPAVAGAQSLAPGVSIQAAAGPTIVDSGHDVSAAVGYAPAARVTLLLGVERTHLSSRITHHDQGSSAFRGGTMTALSGEMRVRLFTAGRVTPYGLFGLGAGLSRPTEAFPDGVTNNIRFMSFGGGAHVRLRARLALFGDARLLIGVEAGETLAIFPVRVGIAWRFH